MLRYAVRTAFAELNFVEHLKMIGFMSRHSKMAKRTRRLPYRITSQAEAINWHSGKLNCMAADRIA